MTMPGQPRIRGNDWGALDPPALGSWTPTLSVSVVIPAYHAERTLAFTLAALEAQTYPGELLEVVIVDDGAAPAIELPDLRPARTRVIRPAGSWGRANACFEGAAAAEGEVIHWLDADMLPARDHVEAQMRWHHLLDHVVVLGHKTFVDLDDLPAFEEVIAAVRDDSVEAMFAGRWSSEHEWVEKIWANTGDLRAKGFKAFHVHVGATASVSRDLYRHSGGMDRTLKLGEDVEMGYRLAMRGAVFIGDREARSWHLGRSTLMRFEEDVRRYNAPFVAQRVPDIRELRVPQGRTYRVPYAEVMVDTAGHTYEQVRFTVDGVLASVPGDLHCILVGPWGSLDDDRRSPLEDPQLDARLLQEEYAGESRVSLLEEATESAFPAQFRIWLPAGWRPEGKALAELLKDVQRRDHGLRCVLLTDGQVARVERTAAFERIRRVSGPGEDPDDVIDQVAPVWWSEGAEEGFVHLSQAPAPASGEPARPADDRAPERPQGAAAAANDRVRAPGRGRPGTSRSGGPTDTTVTRRATARMRRWLGGHRG